MTTPTPTPASYDLSDEAVLAALRETLSDVLEDDLLEHVDLESLGRDTHLLSLPLDSITLVDLMTRLEDRYGAAISEEQAFAFQVVGDLVDHIAAHSTADRSGR
ncbi:acyl carrier protein [Streptomyces sp. NPDC091371]|uniref:acyl carrier protein n=1 Tax=Streptomyces sp. NPDC091371 TaxID=3155303 RepID=UPI003426FE5A